jgi:hypothetical protein
MFTKIIDYIKAFFHKEEKPTLYNVVSKERDSYCHQKDSYSRLFDRVKLLESRLDNIEHVILH